MTFYAFRYYPESAAVLVEFESVKEMAEANATARPGVRYERTTAAEAHAHVRADRIHETALWLDEGRIRRASE